MACCSTASSPCSPSSTAHFKAFDTATNVLATGVAQVRAALLLFSLISADSLGSGSLLLEDWIILPHGRG